MDHKYCNLYFVRNAILMGSICQIHENIEIFFFEDDDNRFFSLGIFSRTWKAKNFLECLAVLFKFFRNRLIK